MSSDDTPDYFLSVADQFKLGVLPTESSNPITANLSQLCSNPDTMIEAMRTLQKADVAAFATVLENSSVSFPKLEELARRIHKTLESGRQVMLTGCGATGRLSLSLEVFCREGLVEEKYRDQIKGFMAGGDAALIRSIEKFEDREPYGARQLRELNFQEGDLLLAVTEGGETPFVIAACEEATRIGGDFQNQYFIYCNPDDILNKVAERSARVLANDKITKINLTCGPMAITGSTRMQATSIQVLACGLALQHHADPTKIRPAFEALYSLVKDQMDYGLLAPMTNLEASWFRSKQFYAYSTDFFTCTVMTDTTERSPTFSLPPFENFDAVPTQPPSPVYLSLRNVDSNVAAWDRLLRRKPRALDWEETKVQTSLGVIHGYDFSTTGMNKRRERLGDDKTQFVMNVDLEPAEEGNDAALPAPLGTLGLMNSAFKGIRFTAVQRGTPEPLATVNLPLPVTVATDILLVNTVGKMLLNAHSTALIAANDRVLGNVMTWVRPTNNKLIDRAARYVKLILERRMAETPGKMEALPSYESIVREIFAVRAVASEDQPIVLQVVDRFWK